MPWLCAADKIVQMEMMYLVKHVEKIVKCSLFGEGSEKPFRFRKRQVVLANTCSLRSCTSDTNRTASMLGTELVSHVEQVAFNSDNHFIMPRLLQEIKKGNKWVEHTTTVFCIQVIELICDPWIIATIVGWYILRRHHSVLIAPKVTMCLKHGSIIIFHEGKANMKKKSGSNFRCVFSQMSNH